MEHLSPVPSYPAAPSKAEACNSCQGCIAVVESKHLPPSQKKLQSSYASLIALLLPGLGFAMLLLLAPQTDRFSFLQSFRTLPWELWVIAIAGTIATLGGLADWAFHRWVAKCKIGRKERRCELIALACGGLPLFLVLAAASVSNEPKKFLLAVIIIALGTTALICYDEFVFHARRCRGLETFFHRLLVFGNGIAFLAWAQWCFVRDLPPLSY